MLALNLLLPLSLLFVLAIGAALWWAIFSGQMDDVETLGASILHDDDTPSSSPAAVSASPPHGMGYTP